MKKVPLPFTRVSFPRSSVLLPVEVSSYSSSSLLLASSEKVSLLSIISAWTKTNIYCNHQLLALLIFRVPPKSDMWWHSRSFLPVIITGFTGDIEDWISDYYLHRLHFAFALVPSFQPQPLSFQVSTTPESRARTLSVIKYLEYQYPIHSSTYSVLFCPIMLFASVSHCIAIFSRVLFL